MRFAVVGQLLAAPPTARGGVRRAIAALAAQTWQHPTTAAPVTFSASTIERWMYAAKGERVDPVSALRRQVRADRGTQPAVSAGFSAQQN